MELKDRDFVRGVRIFLALWALAALAASLWAMKLYPFTEWAWVCGATIAGLLLLFLPMPDVARLALALVLGVAVRLLASHSLAGAQLSGDAVYNGLIVSNILAGRGLTIDLAAYGENIRGMYPPVYLLALAAVRQIGGSALLLNLAADLAAAAALYILSRHDSRVTAAYFLFPSVVLASIVPLKEPLATALLLGAMLFVRRPLAYGLLAGLVVLTQPAWLPVVAVAYLLLERSPRAYGWAAIGALAVLLPWWVRNAILFNEFVPLTTGAGYSLWVAATGTYTSAAGATLGEVAQSAETGRLALAIILSDPLAYLMRVAKAATLALLLNDDVAQAMLTSGIGWVAAAANVANVAWSGLLAWAATSRAAPDRRWTVFALAWLAGILIGVWLEFGARHRLFAIPLLLLWIASARPGHQARPAVD